MKNILKSIAGGISWGCTIMVFMGIVLSVFGKSDLMFAKDEYIRQAICAMVVGIGFCLPSLAYQNDKLSFGIQVLIHMGVGFIVYFPIAFYANWIPVQGGAWAVFATIGFMIFVAVGIWFAFYLYYKKQCQKMNEVIKQRN